MCTVLIADSQPLVRAGLTAVIAAEKDLRVIGLAKDGEEVVRSCLEHHPDLVLMGAWMPSLDGIEATRRVLVKKPTQRVLILCADHDPIVGLECARAGARGHLHQGADTTEILAAIREVNRGRTYFSAEVRTLIVETFIRDNLTEKFIASRKIRIEAPTPDVLSNREREVLANVAQGLTSREIASKLGISVRTVEAHRGRVGEKLSLRSVAELTRYALQHRITEES